MQSVSENLASNWPILTVIAAVIAGVAAFIVNLLKGIESWRNITKKTSKPATEKNTNIKVRVDPGDFGIIPFEIKPSRVKSIEKVVIGGLVGGAIVEGVNHLRDRPPSHEVSTDVPSSDDIPLDQGPIDVGSHQAIVDHVESGLDFIKDMLP
jgi:hypothetical protein